MMPNKKGTRRSFGAVRKLPSGRVQARYTGPDGREYTARTSEGRPLTFDTRGDAEAWLALRQSEIVRDAWRPPAEPKPSLITFDEYAWRWLVKRRTRDGDPLANTTRALYTQLLRDHIVPTFGKLPLASITKADVRLWYDDLTGKMRKRTTSTGKTDTGKRQREQAYALLRTIFNTAMEQEIPGVVTNPCQIRGAGQSKREKTIRPATIPELGVIVEHMPPRFQLMVLLAAWCALRFEELAELRRKDVDLTNNVLHVRKAFTAKGGRTVKDPKSEAGKRLVAIPPHLHEVITWHLKHFAQAGRDGLLFPAQHGEQITNGVLWKPFNEARKAAGRPDLTVHELRHTGATLAAATGATIKELMARLGHSTPNMAIRYQHAVAERDRQIADALSDFAKGDGKAVPLRPANGTRKPRKRKRA